MVRQSLLKHLTMNTTKPTQDKPDPSFGPKEQDYHGIVCELIEG